MAKIHFVDHSGETRTIDVENGATVMEAAIRNAIPGIEAECGGACACATCHVYVDEAWREKVGPPSPMEEDMLDFGFDVGRIRVCPARSRSPTNSTASWFRRRSGRPETAAAIAHIISSNAARRGEAMAEISAMISGVSGVGLRVASSIKTVTDCADATQWPFENTT